MAHSLGFWIKWTLQLWPTKSRSQTISNCLNSYKGLWGDNKTIKCRRNCWQISIHQAFSASHSQPCSSKQQSCLMCVSQCVHWNAVSCIHFLSIHNSSVCPGYTQPSSNFKHQSVYTMWVGWVWTWPGQDHAPTYI